MNIEDIRNKKQELEIHIRELLTQFQDETEVSITDINLHTISNIGLRPNTIVDFRIDITI